MRTMTLTLATVLYGGEDVLAQTIPTWRDAVGDSGIPLVFIDNSPTDAAEHLVRQHLPSADLTRRPGNPGFAASANESITRASTDWVLLLNADVFLSEEAIERCLGWISEPGRAPGLECAAISLVTDGIEHCGVELNAVGYFSDRPADSPRPPLGPSGGAMLIHRETFTRVGAFDADLFAWGEDGGLSLRLFAAGVTTSPLRLRLTHTGGHSVPSLAGQRFKARLLARNRIRVMRRDWAPSLRYSVGPLQFALILLNGIRKLRFRTAAQHMLGIRDGLTERRPDVRRPARFGIRPWLRYRRARITVPR